MRASQNNPAKNQLPQSIKEAALFESIAASGYPLQGIVASKLGALFNVIEEWGYLDHHSKDNRNLDVFARRNFEADSLVQPSLTLLIECKRSQHPYVFFKSVVNRITPNFPLVAGLLRGCVSISDQSRRISEFPGSFVLGLDKCQFVEPGPVKCAAFSKAIPRGGKVDLSGTEPFNSVVLPLIKASDFFMEMQKPLQRPAKLYPSLVLSLCVMDAPMILVETPDRPGDPILTPWVRVVRLQANPGTDLLKRFNFYSLDIVHIDYLDELIRDHILPFADEFCRRAVQLQEVLIEGGIVPSLDSFDWTEIRKK